MAEDGGNDISLPKGAQLCSERGDCARSAAATSAALRAPVAPLLTKNPFPPPPPAQHAATIAKLVREYVPQDLRAATDTVEKLLECCTGRLADENGCCTYSSSSSASCHALHAASKQRCPTSETASSCALHL